MKLFVGFRSEATAEAGRLAAPVTAPRNYKDEKVIAEYLVKEGRHRQTQYARSPCLGRVTEVVCRTDLTSAAQTFKGLGFVDYFLELRLRQTSATSGHFDLDVIGLEVENLFDMILPDYCRWGGLGRIPLELWVPQLRPGRFLDPYRLAVPAPCRDLLDVKGLLTYFGAQDLALETETAAQRCAAALFLAQQMHLV